MYTYVRSLIPMQALMCVSLSTGEPGIFSHLILLHVGRDLLKDGYTSLPLLVQRLVCGTNRLQRVAAESMDLLPSFIV